MRKLQRYVLLFWAVSLLAITATAFAGDKVPEHWKPFQPKFLELKPGYKLYQPDGEQRLIVNTKEGVRYLIVDSGEDEVNQMRMDQAVRLTSACFAEIRTVEQAKELCELLLHGGALVEDAATYKKLLKVHRDFDLQQFVEDKELVFEPLAKAVKDGYQIEFTAFHNPQTIGAQSVVARFKFFVAKDATFKIQSMTYLQSMALNWSAGLLNTPAEQKEEAKQLARVEGFLDECHKCCSTRLPRMSEEKKN